MSKQLMMGNEAMALGAVESGVEVVAAYPGTPSSEIAGTLAKMASTYGYYVEWSTNEKVALEVAAGASYAGARSLAAMKQVGLNVASDALMSLAYIGVKGGLVIIVADDPGPHSSQTEQDTRVFGKFAKLPVFNPSSPREAKEMVKAAFELSEQEGMPVIVRPVTRVCHGCQEVEIDEELLAAAKEKRKHRFEKNPRWIIFPRLAYERHQWLVEQERKLALAFETSPFNQYSVLKKSGGRPTLGIITSGIAYCYTREALQILDKSLDEKTSVEILNIGTCFPLPGKLILRFVRDLDVLLIAEEQDPFLEENICALLYREGKKVKICGKESGHLPYAGEYSPGLIIQALRKLGAEENLFTISNEVFNTPAEAKPAALPVRPPVFCAGCPHRSSFYLFKEAAKELDAVFTGDIGCYTLGNAPPLSALDTCLCMGAGVTIATGMERAEPERTHVGFVGDSTFFHACLPGLVNAVYNKAKITLVVLDNSTTAMTGHQPHPGMGLTAMGEKTGNLDIAGICRALGVKYVEQVSPLEFDRFKKIAREAMEFPGPAVVVAREPCAAIVKGKRVFEVNKQLCKNCGICIKKIGCPAMTAGEDAPFINDLCRGCGLCAYVCPRSAVREVDYHA